MNKIARTTRCRITGEPLTPLFTLGALHVSDFLKPNETPRTSPIELELCLAKKSGLVQLAHTTPGDIMYQQYWYRSGTNASMTAELKGIAERAAWIVKPKPGDIHVDIGCNDGTLLSFVDHKLTRVGFEPAKNNYTASAKQHADLVINDFFNAKAFRASKFGKQKAKIVTSIAMFYDLPDPDAFVKDVHTILDNDGLWIIQMSYLPLMLQQLAFDNICHEHLEYYSLAALEFLLKRHGFQVLDVELNETNGGSFRVYIVKEKADIKKFGTAPYRDVAAHRVASLRAHEKTLKLDKPITYRNFFKDISALKKETVDFIKKETTKGKTVWAYGASTKGNTLLQWYGLDNRLIQGIAERAPTKFGLKTVGSNIPIYSEDDMRKAQPDYLLVLPWHFIEEFKQRESNYLNKGGKFIVPCPKFEIIGA